MRRTPVREMVLEQVCLLPQPFTADQLVQACAAERISIGSIYNTLSLFVSARILHAINRQHGRTSTQYELIQGNTIRLQIICSKCQRVTTFKDKAIENLVMTRMYSNFNAQRISMFVYGECKHCRRPERNDKKE